VEVDADAEEGTEDDGFVAGVVDLGKPGDGMLEVGRNIDLVPSTSRPPRGGPVGGAAGPLGPTRDPKVGEVGVPFLESVNAGVEGVDGPAPGD